MAATSRSTKLSPDLAEACELRARLLGYPSWNAYIKALIRYDLMIQGGHDVTRPICHLRLGDQDKVDAELLKLTQDGVGVRGQWLEYIIRRIAQAAPVEAAPGKIGAALAEG